MKSHRHQSRLYFLLAFICFMGLLFGCGGNDKKIVAIDEGSGTINFSGDTSHTDGLTIGGSEWISEDEANGVEYVYFISYCFTEKYGYGYGNASTTSNEEITTIGQIKEIEKELEKGSGRQYVVTNYTLLRRQVKSSTSNAGEWRGIKE